MFKMCLYILKTNEAPLLQLNFEDILNKISEQPKLILCGNCQTLNQMERELHLLSFALSGNQEGEPEQQQQGEEQTLYMRFKKELKKDDEGNDLHIDFLMQKFEKEFDQQSLLSEVKKKGVVDMADDSPELKVKQTGK